MLSRANEKGLRAAIEAINEVLSKLGSGGVAESMTEAERSANEKQSLIHRALRVKLLQAGSEQWCYVSEVFDTYFIYESGSRYFKADYSIAKDGTVTVGDGTEVIRRTVYESGTREVSEADITGDLVPLMESEISEASANLRIIKPGWGSSGFYGPAVLKRDGPAVFTKGTKMYWNHQTKAEEAARPEGNLDHFAGELLEDARYDEKGTHGPGLYAKAKVFDRFKEVVKELAPHIGVSIRASGKISEGEADGKKGPIIERIAAAKSIDYVTVPGAGGQILELFEAAGRGPVASIPPKENNDMDKVQIEALITESLKPLKEENARLRETLALNGARQFIERKLAGVTLPVATKQRLAESLVMKATVKDGALDEAALTTVIESDVKAEATYLESVGIGTGRVFGMGGSTTVTEPKQEELDKALATTLAKLGGLSEAAGTKAAEGRFAA